MAQRAEMVTEGERALPPYSQAMLDAQAQAGARGTVVEVRACGAGAILLPLSGDGYKQWRRDSVNQPSRSAEILCRAVLFYVEGQPEPGREGATARARELAQLGGRYVTLYERMAEQYLRAQRDRLGVVRGLLLPDADAALAEVLSGAVLERARAARAQAAGGAAALLAPELYLLEVGPLQMLCEGLPYQTYQVWRDQSRRDPLGAAELLVRYSAKWLRDDAGTWAGAEAVKRLEALQAQGGVFAPLWDVAGIAIEEVIDEAEKKL